MMLIASSGRAEIMNIHIVELRFVFCSPCRSHWRRLSFRPMWWRPIPGTRRLADVGRHPDRNMVSNMKGLPTEWDVKTKKNVKWVADLGSQSYGNPVVADGMVFVGTNNESPRDPKQPGDRGVLMAFRESDGEFLWQQTHEKLASGRANDWPYQGVASSPLVEGSASTT